MNKNIDETNQSIYCYEGTSILINKNDIRDKEVLANVENILVTVKLARLIESSEGNILLKNNDFSLEHYLELHKYLFGDLYEFAGKIREEFTNKSNDEIPGETGIRIYCSPNFIYEALKLRLKKMKLESLRVKTREQLISFLSNNFMELYFIHPFREGNSRTLREFLREYVEKKFKDLNFNIEYSRLNNDDRQNFIKATIWDISKDKEKQKNSINLLNQVFDKCLVEKQINPIR